MEHLDAYQLCKETRARVASLHRSVERGACVTEAINFCRFLQFSGLLKLLKQHSCEGVLPVDGALTEWEVSELLALALRSPVRDTVSNFEERILKNLDVLAGAVQKLNQLPAVDRSFPRPQRAKSFRRSARPQRSRTVVPAHVDLNGNNFHEGKTRRASLVIKQSKLP